MTIPVHPAPPPLHVAAAVVRDDAGRILFAQRVAPRDYAERWEFPGGKIEPGESVEQALERELAEELGIRVLATRPLISVPFADFGRRPLRLDVHEILRYEGEPQGCEGQALRWCDEAGLARLTVPPADLPVVAALLQTPWYAITPDPADDHERFLRDCDALLHTGIRRLQLRARALAPDARAELAARLRALTAAAGAELLLNGDVALAERLGCGLHLTSAQLEEGLRPTALPLAASCHSTNDLRRAERLGCDFVVLGPVAPTATHPHAVPLGWERFAELRECTALPVYALGGLQREDLAIARGHGAQGIAAIRGFWPAHSG
jgi:8-oxo-dGTP diphosphatase